MKYAWIDAHRDQYAITRLCRVLDVSRSGYCQWRVRPPSARELANKTLDARVATIHGTSRRSYGRARIVQALRQQGLTLPRFHVQQVMQPVGQSPMSRVTGSGLQNANAGGCTSPQSN